MTTRFRQAISAFCATRINAVSLTTFWDADSLFSSLGDPIDDLKDAKVAFEHLKKDIKAATEIVKPIIEKIKKQTDLIAKMAGELIEDTKEGGFTPNNAVQIGMKIGAAMLAIDEAVYIVATEVARGPGPNGEVNPKTRDDLMEFWNPWVRPFQELGADSGKLLDSFGMTVFGHSGTTKDLCSRLSYDSKAFRVAATLGDADISASHGVLQLNKIGLEAFLSFARTQYKVGEVTPQEIEDKQLVLREGGTWWQPDQAVFGLRVFTKIKVRLQDDPLLKKVMPGSGDPETLKPSMITFDSVHGLCLGDGLGSGNEKLSLPFQFNFPGVEIRELALGIVRGPGPKREVTGLELTTIIAAKLGDAVGLQIGGAGVTMALDGPTNSAAMFPWAVSPRWPDAIGLRVKAGPIKGGGYLERKVRTYSTGEQLVEFGAVVQLEILKVGVSAIVILSPDPFSLVLVMGVRFPTPIELSFGFTFNGVGGILALNRRVDTGALRKGIETHFIDQVLFPDDALSAAPTILDKVARVFPPYDGGFVVGPVIELGWGSQAKIIEAKIGIVLALPHPKIILLGAVRVRAPSKVTPLTDFRCEVYGEISSDRLLIIATLRDSTIAGYKVSGDLGLLIQWGGGGAFALSVGGFNPRYTEAPAALQGLTRLTVDFSPPAIVTIIVKAYFAVTAGSVMAGINGDLKADILIATAHAWLSLDMIFRWAPQFGFAVDLDLGIEIDVFGHSFAEVSFKGSLEGTTPWKIHGTATVDVWFLSTYHFELGPYSWGDNPPPIEPLRDPLTIVQLALNEPGAWKAVMPLDGDLLVNLDRVEEVVGLVAHPFAALEITQSRLPLETHIDRIGSAGVSSNRVNLGLATTQGPGIEGTPVGAMSTVRAPFSPGQFLALEGEALLARSGFDDLPCGCRVAAATTPVSGTVKQGMVSWRTYFGKIDNDDKPRAYDLKMFADLLVAQSLVGRVVAERENPYESRTAKVNPKPGTKVSVLPIGASTVHKIDDGGVVLADLGVLTASEAARVADVVNLSGAGQVAAVAVGVM